LKGHFYKNGHFWPFLGVLVNIKCTREPMARDHKNGPKTLYRFCDDSIGLLCRKYYFGPGDLLRVILYGVPSCRSQCQNGPERSKSPLFKSWKNLLGTFRVSQKSIFYLYLWKGLENDF
jgi:hypothetical protein